ncbi:MAG: Coenzyme F420 hydrogenase/dehydrogenase, beta subunit C-terminal domain [Rhodospirillales bacterium]|nr:Coenzyme F420 hydrogenase/dehydrogenase, beta subunit C-terminal domain [Rhodospirillales bacterium]
MGIKSLDDIVEAGLCAGCGICESIAGRDAVEMDLADEGRVRPRTKALLGQGVFDQIMQVCPGVTVTGPEKNQAGSSGTTHDIYGPIATLNRGWAGDDKVRFHAAAGGSLTALGTFLLESGRVEAVLHVKASTDNPMMSDAHISTSASDVFDGAQSRYGPAAPLTHVHRLLDEGRTFAVIGKPCDVAAIRNLARIDARVEKQIPYCLTIFCGSVPSLRMPSAMAAYFGVAADELSLFRWRGDGWPGTTHMETRDGRAFDLTYDQSYFEEDMPWKYDAQFRCKICPDAIGELADVACPDGWIMENGKPLHEEAPGANVIVARTLKGAELVRAAQAAGALVLEPYSEAELEIMHVDHKPRKISWPARMMGMRLAGQPSMQVNGYRKCAAVRASGPVYFLKSLFGSFNRARKGLSRENGFQKL